MPARQYFIYRYSPSNRVCKYIDLVKANSHRAAIEKHFKLQEKDIEKIKEIDWDKSNCAKQFETTFKGKKRKIAFSTERAWAWEW